MMNARGAERTRGNNKSSLENLHVAFQFLQEVTEAVQQVGMKY